MRKKAFINKGFIYVRGFGWMPVDGKNNGDRKKMVGNEVFRFSR
jgi:hypothetical protein